MLREMEADGRIVNSFRLIFDFQDVEYEQIPVEFLTNHSVVMYICDDNMEDMEGFNDVWANILNQDLVDLNKMIDMTMDNQEDTKVLRMIQDIRQHDQSVALMKDRGVLETENLSKDMINISVDQNVREDLLNLSNISVIRNQFNETKIEDSVIEENHEMLNEVL